MLYRYSTSSSTTINLFLFIRIANIVVGKVNSHTMVPRFVFLMCSRRGEGTSATIEVEKSISIMEILPSLLSLDFEKGSVVNVRNPLVVPTDR